jgi:hypothetical protein
MLKFTSVSDSAQGITGITRTVTTIRTGRTIITDRIIGTVGTAITAIITPIITGASFGTATPGWLEVASSLPEFSRVTGGANQPHEKGDLFL